MTAGRAPTDRLARLVRGAVGELELDLTGATVLTEAGTGAFAATPVAAAAAGARVCAVTADSGHGSADEVMGEVEALVRAAGVDDGVVEIVRSREAVPPGVDVVTNLGFVRPVDESVLGKLSDAGVVSLMAESWELRPGDVDVAACRRLGVPVAGVFEDFGGLDVFRSCGPLAVKLCFEAGLEVAGSELLVLGGDRFAPVIAEALRANLAKVHQVETAAALTEERVAGADAIVVADYLATDTVLGGPAGPSASELAGWNPSLTIVQFAGPVDADGLTAAGIAVLPPHRLEPMRMAATLGHLGPRPVVYLHTAGLKVGELLWRRRRDGAPLGRYAELVQEVA